MIKCKYRKKLMKGEKAMDIPTRNLGKYVKDYKEYTIQWEHYRMNRQAYSERDTEPVDN